MDVEQIFDDDFVQLMNLSVHRARVSKGLWVCKRNYTPYLTLFYSRAPFRNPDIFHEFDNFFLHKSQFDLPWYIHLWISYIYSNNKRFHKWNRTNTVRIKTSWMQTLGFKTLFTSYEISRKHQNMKLKIYGISSTMQIFQYLIN